MGVYWIAGFRYQQIHRGITMELIRAVLVENLDRPHRMYRRILERLEGIELTDAFHYPEELIERLDRGLRPDVIVMDAAHGRWA